MYMYIFSWCDGNNNILKSSYCTLANKSRYDKSYLGSNESSKSKMLVIHGVLLEEASLFSAVYNLKL